MHYSSLLLSIRTLYDAMLGNYSYSGMGTYNTLHSILLMIHIFISNIFLLNYLIAILSTVYTVMLEKGDFAFKSNKYQFIERYSIAMLDKWGYHELVIHPPPINFFTIFLIPTMFQKSLMKRASEVFSRFMFWMENIVFIFFFILYEFLLVPFIYLRLVYNILRLA